MLAYMNVKSVRERHSCAWIPYAYVNVVPGVNVVPMRVLSPVAVQQSYLYISSNYNGETMVCPAGYIYPSPPSELVPLIIMSRYINY